MATSDLELWLKAIIFKSIIEGDVTGASGGDIHLLCFYHALKSKRFTTKTAEPVNTSWADCAQHRKQCVACITSFAGEAKKNLTTGYFYLGNTIFIGGDCLIIAACHVTKASARIDIGVMNHA